MTSPAGANGVSAGDSRGDGTELSPDAIAGARFVKSLRGYNRDDVESFLRGVAADYRRVLEELHSLRDREDAARALQADRSHEAPGGDQHDGGNQPAERSPRPGGSFDAIPAASVVTGASMPRNGSAPPSGGDRPAPQRGPGSLVLASDAGELPRGEVGSAVAAIFLRADEDSWRVREDAEHDFDRLRHEVSMELAEAGERATELRRKARETASEMMDSRKDPNEIASEVSLLLTEADKMASQVVERATSRARQLRRSAFSRLVDAEMRARQVVAEAQDDATALLRMLPVPGAAGADADGSETER